VSTAPLTPGPLSLSGLTVQAGSTTLLEHLDLRFFPGELVAIIGPSGAGKSTLFTVVLGVRKPSRGEVRLGDGPVSAAGPIGYVPQDDALHRVLTVRQALGFSARLRLPDATDAQREARIAEVVKTVGLDARLDLRIRKLSGGQRKRVSVALELLTAPGVLVLDEPTSGLDPGLEAHMMGLFRGLAEGGRVVLVSTHAMASLDRCHVVVVLVAGRVAYAGPPAEAPAWFESPDLNGMFDRIAKRAPLVWAKQWQQSPASGAFRRRTGPALPGPTAPAAAAAPGPASRPARPSAAEELARLKAEMGKGPPPGAP
jgi:ABC-type multidrug transport system ATPase subunit